MKALISTVAIFAIVSVPSRIKATGYPSLATTEQIPVAIVEGPS
jgi:hypothetical protein